MAAEPGPLTGAARQTTDGDARAAWNGDRWEIDPSMIPALRRCWPSLVVLDCRRAEELEASSVEGATHIPMEEVLQRRAELGTDEERPVVVFCRTGRRSLVVTKVLRVEGRANVRSLRGGLLGWHGRALTNEHGDASPDA